MTDKKDMNILKMLDSALKKIHPPTYTEEEPPFIPVKEFILEDSGIAVVISKPRVYQVIRAKDDEPMQMSVKLIHQCVTLDGVKPSIREVMHMDMQTVNKIMSELVKVM